MRLRIRWPWRENILWRPHDGWDCALGSRMPQLSRRLETHGKQGVAMEEATERLILLLEASTRRRLSYWIRSCDLIHSTGS